MAIPNTYYQVKAYKMHELALLSASEAMQGYKMSKTFPKSSDQRQGSVSTTVEYCTAPTFSITCNNFHFVCTCTVLIVLEVDLIQNKGPDIVTESICVQSTLQQMWLILVTFNNANQHQHMYCNRMFHQKLETVDTHANVASV